MLVPEEMKKSRSKEKIFSLRANNAWDPKIKDPNFGPIIIKKNKNETFRVFPLSNWTEIDIWNYIEKEKYKNTSTIFCKKKKGDKKK